MNDNVAGTSSDITWFEIDDRYLWLALAAVAIVALLWRWRGGRASKDDQPPGSN